MELLDPRERSPVAKEPVTVRVPALTIVLPVVLAPDKVSVPVPCLINVPEPVIEPLKVDPTNEELTIKFVAPRVTVPDPLRSPIENKLRKEETPVKLKIPLSRTVPRLLRAPLPVIASVAIALMVVEPE